MANKHSILQLNHIKKYVEKDRLLLDDITLEIQQNALVAIIGPSGSGKTTLLKAMSGFDQRVEGDILYIGEGKDAITDSLQIGYVPQENIIHENLTLLQMLTYAALLRLPKHTDKQSITERIHKVMSDLELTYCSTQCIRNLSGGEKKRANLAVELLSDPQIFLLDEPTTGLDIYTELSLIKTLKNLTKEGKTIVYVSHTPLELEMCDQVIVIGKGGTLCFSGTQKEMFAFFQTEDYLEIYQEMEMNSKKWQKKYREQRANNTKKKGVSIFTKDEKNKDKLHQFHIMTRRYIRLLLNDRKNLCLMFLQAPILSFALYMVTRDGLYELFWDTQEMLFALTCVGIWMGLFNSLREICKEKDIMKREYINHISLGCMIASKLIVLLCICAIQSTSLSFCYGMLTQFPKYSFLLPPFLEMCTTLFLITYGATCMGLCISAVFDNQEKVMSAAPYILIPQLLFSGVLYELHGILSIIAKGILSYWGVNALSISAHLTTLAVKEEVILSGPYQGLSFAPAIPSKEYLQYTLSALLQNWLILLLGCLLMIALCYHAVKRQMKN